MNGLTVMAIGDSGQFEPTPASEAVTIRSTPLSVGNLVIPATVRWMAMRGGHVPTKLLRVSRPNKRNRRQHVYITFECTPFERYRTDSGPVYGDWLGCSVRNAAEAADPIFAWLSESERARIRRAVLEVSA